MIALKQKVKKKLENSPDLQKVGMVDDSGSDSDPDTGENTSNVLEGFNRTMIRTSKITRKNINSKGGSNPKMKSSLMKKDFIAGTNFAGKIAKT